MEARESIGTREQPWRDTLLLTVWFGLVAGLVEAIAYAILRVTTGRSTWRWVFVNTPPDVFWVAPLLSLCLFFFLAIGLKLALAPAGKLPLRLRVDTLQILVFLFAATEIFVLLRLTNRIPAWGCFVLALGVAFQLARWFSKTRPRWFTLFRKTTPALVFIVGLIAVGLLGGQRVREAYLTRQLPPVPEGTPNVLVIVLDTLRADHLSSYGYERATTPHLDQLAAEGTLFQSAFAPSSWTLPTHATLLTGRAVSEHRADSMRPFLDETYPTLGEFLSSKGFVTAAFSANKWWVTRNTGLDRGFLHFEDYYSPATDVLLRSPLGSEVAVRFFRVTTRLGYRNTMGRKRAEHVNRDFLAWLDGNQDRPFFVLLNYIDTHTPYLSPPPFHTKYMDPQQRAQESKDRMEPWELPRENVEDKIPLWVAAYDGALSYTDAELGRLLDDLRRRGLLDNTLVIVTSDHGEAFGEHGLFQHTHSLYKEVLHVPLILRLPGAVPEAYRVAEPVSLQDLPATIASLLFGGAEHVFPGRSLSECWAGNPAESRPAGPVLSEVGARPWAPKGLPYSTGWLKSLATPEWHLILHEKGNVELFDLPRDEQEARNLADTLEGRKAVEELKQQLDGIVPLVSNKGRVAGVGPR